MSITLRSSAQASSLTTSVECSAPSGFVANDILLALVFARASAMSPVTSAPSGWEVIERGLLGTASGGVTNESITLFWKRAVGDETSFSFTGTETPTHMVAVVAAYSGCAPSGTPYSIASNTLYTTNDQLAKATKVLVSVENSMLVFAGARGYNAANTWTEPSGFTKQVDYNPSYSVVLADLLQASPGWTPDYSATFSAFATPYKHALMLALLPETANVSVIYASDTTVYGLRCGNATYTTARSGSGTLLADTANAGVGQFFTAGVYYCRELPLSFDTSNISDSATIVEATLSLGLKIDYLETDSIIEVRAYDFGASVGSEDFIPGDNISNYTLLASMDTSSFAPSSSYQHFVSDSAFLSNIIKDGPTKLMLNDDRMRLGTVPTGSSHFYFNLPTAAELKPKLTVVSATSVPIITTSSISGITSSTASGGGNVVDVVGATGVVHGLCWSTSTLPTIAGSKTNPVSGSGSFTEYITGLSPLTKYHVRAYATSELGTGYGNEVDFVSGMEPSGQYNIDGYIIYVHKSSSSGASYDFNGSGRDYENEQTFIVPYDKTDFTLHGTASDLYYNIGVQSYRSVDQDVDTNGVVYSTITQPSGVGQTYYRPNGVVTVGGQPVTGIVQASSGIIIDNLRNVTRINTGGITISTASGDSGQRLSMTNAGIKGWDNSSNQRVQISNDGSGYFGSPTGIVWSNTGAPTISIGTGNSIFVAGPSGIQLGHATFTSAPFRVTTAGAVTASNITISPGSNSFNFGTGGTIGGTLTIGGSVVLHTTSVDGKVLFDGASGTKYVDYAAGFSFMGNTYYGFGLIDANGTDGCYTGIAQGSSNWAELYFCPRMTIYGGSIEITNAGSGGVNPTTRNLSISIGPNSGNGFTLNRGSTSVMTYSGNSSTVTFYGAVKGLHQSTTGTYLADGKYTYIGMWFQMKDGIVVATNFSGPT